MLHKFTQSMHQIAYFTSQILNFHHDEIDNWVFVVQILEKVIDLVNSIPQMCRSRVWAIRFEGDCKTVCTKCSLKRLAYNSKHGRRFPILSLQETRPHGEIFELLFISSQIRPTIDQQYFAQMNP